MLRSIFLVLFAINLSCLGAGATENLSVSKIKKLVVVIPANIEKDAKSRDALIDKLISMEQQAFVYLDLSIAMTGKKPYPYSVTINGKPPRRAFQYSFGTLPMGAGIVYSMGPIAGYNHLLLDIYTGDRANFPYLDISREYESHDVGRTAFHVRGFFHVLVNSVPTARSFQLRPVNPPFEIAVKYLAQ